MFRLGFGLTNQDRRRCEVVAVIAAHADVDMRTEFVGYHNVLGVFEFTSPCPILCANL
jgi:hypothetical protein